MLQILLTLVKKLGQFDIKESCILQNQLFKIKANRKIETLLWLKLQHWHLPSLSYLWLQAECHMIYTLMSLTENKTPNDYACCTLCIRIHQKPFTMFSDKTTIHFLQSKELRHMHQCF